jgi:hypothetical protein
MAKQLTTNLVANRLKEAAEALKRLPEEKLQYLKANWPETIPVWSDYGDEKSSPPSLEAVNQMDEAINWLHWLEPDETKLAWAVASGVNRKVIGASLGVHRSTIWREWTDIISKLTAIINLRQEMNYE